MAGGVRDKAESVEAKAADGPLQGAVVGGKGERREQHVVVVEVGHPRAQGRGDEAVARRGAGRLADQD
eukprot:1090468-Heterocapsa_arctica.AAC.1